MTGDLSEFDAADPSRTKRKVLGQIADLLERNGISTDDIGQVHRVNIWQGMSKDADGEVQVTDLTGIQLSPVWAEGPEWPVIAPAKPTIVRPGALRSVKRPAGFGVAMTLPDMQIGYYVDGSGELRATHDEAAIDVALQLVRYTRPSKVVLHGDNLDLPELSRYRLTPVFARTTQATVDRAGLFAAQLRAAAGDECTIEWIEGNHELRLSTYIIDNAKAAFGLKRANAPDSWPVLSVPHLCNLDAHGVTYLAGYPAAETWINHRLRVVHGDHVASNGSTAHKYLANERSSVVYGHVHRREWAERTRPTHDGPRTILAMSPGCLCRTDGAVPSTKSGMDLNGVPVSNVEDWQQGVAVFSYEEGEGRFVPEQVPIHDGWTLYHGREFVAGGAT
jgi:hypothetical protein